MCFIIYYFNCVSAFHWTEKLRKSLTSLFFEVSFYWYIGDSHLAAWIEKGYRFKRKCVWSGGQNALITTEQTYPAPTSNWELWWFRHWWNSLLLTRKSLISRREEQHDSVPGQPSPFPPTILFYHQATNTGDCNTRACCTSGLLGLAYPPPRNAQIWTQLALPQHLVSALLSLP